MFKIIQLRWSDEENWRDVQAVEVGAVDETLEVLRRNDAEVTKKYGHKHHALFRVKPEETA